MTAEIETLWTVALVVSVVVVLVVTVLLHLILRTARRIHVLVSRIWTGGTHIAANTVNIAHLERTNFLAGSLLASAAGIASAAGRIRKATAR